MPLRVCILTRETALHWAAYYVAAFRECCDVIAIGPVWNPGDAVDFAKPEYIAPSIVRNDITSDATDAGELLALLPPGWNPDLLVTIQSGAPPVGGIARAGCPTVYLSIDTWHDPREFIVARQYDFVFLAQKALVKYMRQAGCRHAWWLPLACDPAAHYLAPGEESFDFAFIGRIHFVANRQRVARLNELGKHFKVAVYNGLNEQDMARAYGTARAAFNASIAQDVNMRVFEALATGKPLLTNREAEVNGLFELFADEEHLITFTDENLAAQARRCIEEPDWARAIGEAGKREVLEKHTYAHRVRALEEKLKEMLPALGSRVYPRFKQGNKLFDFLPFGTQRVLDVGMALETSRISLRRAGVTYVTAVATESAMAEERAMFYDAVVPIAELHEIGETDFDMVIWKHADTLGLGWAQVFSMSAHWLAEGGAIMLIVDEEVLAPTLGDIDTGAIEAWLVAHGFTFQVRRAVSEESGPHVIVARQWSATLESIIAELYREFPTNGVVPEHFRGALSEPIPGSPDAGHP